ncbi:MAG: hypothetical protein ACOCUR_02610 [Nanoarchaeota archaeon]
MLDKPVSPEAIILVKEVSALVKSKDTVSRLTKLINTSFAVNRCIDARLEIIEEKIRQTNSYIRESNYEKSTDTIAEIGYTASVVKELSDICTYVIDISMKSKECEYFTEGLRGAIDEHIKHTNHFVDIAQRKIQDTMKEYKNLEADRKADIEIDNYLRNKKYKIE